MRVLVCGGRNYDNGAKVATELERVFREAGGDLVVIHGGAPGADTLAGMWADLRGVPVNVYHAEWSTYGKAAGPRRNAWMLEDGKPDMVLSFPGGDGTADMVRKAMVAGVRVENVGGEYDATPKEPPHRAAGPQPFGESGLAVEFTRKWVYITEAGNTRRGLALTNHDAKELARLIGEKLRNGSPAQG